VSGEVPVHSTQVTRRVEATPAAVYAALLDAEAVARWRVPDGMAATVHEFEPAQGGRFRVSLTYDDPAAAGKSGGHTDTYHGHFARLVPEREIVEVLEFETDDPALRGAMTMTTSLRAVGAGTEVTVRHEGLPDAVPAADNETGTRMALAKLAALVEPAGSAG
jgi:uncharacterized protein YndB with AHSA1/START domain